ncbi:MAG: hypothetical protein ACYC3W_10500, partial [Candidatus Nanopelagicales bacterium]
LFAGSGIAMAAVGSGNAASNANSIAADAQSATTPDAVGSESTTLEAEAATTVDGANQGPDVNATEPGHQDAATAGEVDSESSTESATAADGPNQGPDANATEPGHQDAN